MVAIRHEGVCAAPVSVAFAYIDDYRTVPDWMFGLSAFTPVDPELSHGLGAAFDGAFAVKPIKLSSRVETVEWEQDAVIALDSVKGFKNTSRWTFHADGPERTRIEVEFNYELPGGLAGKAMGKALEPVIAMSVRQSDANLRRNIEAAYAEQTSDDHDGRR